MSLPLTTLAAATIVTAGLVYPALAESNSNAATRRGASGATAHRAAARGSAKTLYQHGFTTKLGNNLRISVAQRKGRYDVGVWTRPLRTTVQYEDRANTFKGASEVRLEIGHHVNTREGSRSATDVEWKTVTLRRTHDNLYKGTTGFTLKEGLNTSGDRRAFTQTLTNLELAVGPRPEMWHGAGTTWRGHRSEAGIWDNGGNRAPGQPNNYLARWPGKLKIQPNAPRRVKLAMKLLDGKQGNPIVQYRGLTFNPFILRHGLPTRGELTREAMYTGDLYLTLSSLGKGGHMPSATILKAIRRVRDPGNLKALAQRMQTIISRWGSRATGGQVREWDQLAAWAQQTLSR